MQHVHVLKKLILIFWPHTSGPWGRGSVCKIFATMLLHSWFPLIWYATWPCFEKLKFDLLTQSLGLWARGVCGKNICYNVAAFMIPFNLICKMTIFWKSWILTYWPHPKGGVVVCRQNICYHAAAFRDSLLIDMQHDDILKKLHFDLLTPSPGLWGLGSAGKIFGTIMLHSWFSLIWYATWLCSEKVECWPTDPIPRVWGGGLQVKYLLPCCCIHDSIQFDMEDVHILK